MKRSRGKNLQPQMNCAWARMKPRILPMGRLLQAPRELEVTIIQKPGVSQALPIVPNATFLSRRTHRYPRRVCRNVSTLSARPRAGIRAGERCDPIGGFAILDPAGDGRRGGLAACRRSLRLRLHDAVCDQPLCPSGVPLLLA